MADRKLNNTRTIEHSEMVAVMLHIGCCNASYCTVMRVIYEKSKADFLIDARSKKATRRAI